MLMTGCNLPVSHTYDLHFWEETPGRKVETRAPGANTEHLPLSLSSIVLQPAAGWVIWSHPWVGNRVRAGPTLPRIHVAGYRMRPGSIMIRPGYTPPQAMVGSVGEKEEATKKALLAPFSDTVLACVLPPCSILPSRQTLDSQTEETHRSASLHTF